MFISNITHMPITQSALVGTHEDNLFNTSEEYRKEVLDMLTPTEQEDNPITAFTFILGYN
jgi:hypothetical protein